MITARIPVLGIAAFSGTGKTTLLEQVLPELRRCQLRVGMIKASHHTMEFDTPGKDSYRLRHAGAQQLVLSMPQRSVCYTEYPAEHPRQLQEQVGLLDQSQLDLILVEGFREAPIPKIELHRSAYQKPFLFQTDPQVIALAWDAPCPVQIPDRLRLLDLNDPLAVARFIIDWAQRANKTEVSSDEE